MRASEQPFNPAGRESVTNAAVGPVAALAQIVGRSGTSSARVVLASMAVTGLKMLQAAPAWSSRVGGEGVREGAWPCSPRSWEQPFAGRGAHE